MFSEIHWDGDSEAVFVRRSRVDADRILVIQGHDQVELTEEQARLLIEGLKSVVYAE